MIGVANKDDGQQGSPGKQGLVERRHCRAGGVPPLVSQHRSANQGPETPRATREIHNVAGTRRLTRTCTIMTTARAGDVKKRALFPGEKSLNLSHA